MSTDLTKAFIDTCIKNQTQVQVFLESGVALKGEIALNGIDSLTLKRDGVSQLVFHHAIATILPQN